MSREEKINKMIEEIKIRRNDEQYRGGPFPIYHIEFDILNEEIERLKTELEIEQDISDGMLEAIDKAIEYIDYYLKNGHTKDWKQLEYSLLEILKKEENNESSSIDRETN